MSNPRIEHRRRSARRHGPLVLLAVLVLVGAPAASAGAATWGGHDDPWDRLEDLAEELEDSADRVLKEGERDERRRRGHRDRGRLRVLEELEDCADELEDRVDGERSLRASMDAFGGLTRLHREAERLYHRSGNHRLREELYRMGRLLHQFDRQVDLALAGRRGVHRDRGRHRGGYDEDWRRRGRGPRATIVLPRIRIDIPF